MSINSVFVPCKKIFSKVDQYLFVNILISKISSYDDCSHVHFINKNNDDGICIYYNSSILSKNDILSRVSEQASQISGCYTSREFRVTGLVSEDCALHAENCLNEFDGVYSAMIDFASKKVSIIYNQASVSYSDINAKLAEISILLVSDNKYLAWFNINKELIFSVFAGVILLLSWVLDFFHYNSLSFFTVIISYYFGLYYTLQHCIKSIINIEFDIDCLMLIAAVGAGFINQWYEGGLLLFLFSLGHALEHKAMDRASYTIKKLSRIAPRHAIIKVKNELKRVAVASLDVGDSVVVRAGERIPCDGKIIVGKSMINEAAITGESAVVNKVSSDRVFAGTLNCSGSLTIKVTKKYQDNTIQKMLSMILSASEHKSRVQSFTERFEQIFAPIIVMTVILITIIPPLFFNVSFSVSFYRAILILVAASPCALAISTPVVVMSAVSRAASLGVLIKGGLQLDVMSKINHLAIDKTGTITLGQVEVEKIVSLSNIDESYILSLAASLEQSSCHPIALSLVHAAVEKGLSLSIPRDVKEVFGKGVTGIVSGKKVSIGIMSLFTNVPEKIKKMYNDIQQSGSTVLLVKQSHNIIGLIALSDSKRDNVGNILQRLKNLGIKKIVMLTGDNKEVANSVAADVGIDEVYSSLLPEDKVEKIKQLSSDPQNKVAMLGDGINDAPAMSSAALGIAMASMGNDVTSEVADVVVLQNDLKKLPISFALAKYSISVMKQNICLAVTSIVLLIISSIFNMMSLSMTVLIHEGTTLLVVINGLRLLRF